jgi:hypothetical protein
MFKYRHIQEIVQNVIFSIMEGMIIIMRDNIAKELLIDAVGK